MESLLETFYKIISAVLAKRLKPVLDKLLNHEQEAYIPGKTAYNLFAYANEN